MNDTACQYKTAQGEAQCTALYETALQRWPVVYDEMFVSTRLGSTHVIASGSKGAAPLVLLHGQVSGATMWAPNIAGLSQDSRVYALDTIDDIGKSRASRLPESREDYAAWLLDVFDELELPQADLAGMSYGGFLALNFALAFPGRVRRLVLLCPGFPNLGRPTRGWLFYGAPMILSPSRFTVRHFMRGASRKRTPEGDLICAQMTAGLQALRRRVPIPPEFTDDELGQLTVPALLLIGAHEIMYDPSTAASTACRLIPSLQAEIIPGASHFLNSDQPEKVNDSILRFL